MNLLASVLGNPMVTAAIRIAGLSLLAGAVTATVSFFYRVRVRTKFPEGATLIVGLGVVALYLNTRLVFIQFLGDAGDPLTVGEAMLNVAVFVAAGFASYAGQRIGDSAAISDRISWDRLQPNVTPIVRATGRYITVTLPEDVDDIEGYDPVSYEVKEPLEGRKLDFPRGLTVTELHTQLVSRLREEYGIGYVDVDLATDGTVEYLAVGRRAAGIGPTLPPRAAAVAVRADPPFSATPGDTVQIWQNGDDGERRVGTGELRANVDNVATVATDENVAESVDPCVDYRLMTLSADSQPDREFAAMLRRGDETMGIVEIGDDSPLVGSAVGAIETTIIAIRSRGGDVETIPRRDRTIQPRDSLFAIGRPELLRRLESLTGTQLLESDESLQAGAADALRLDDIGNGKSGYTTDESRRETHLQSDDPDES